jgi:hypothetical protein
MRRPRLEFLIVDVVGYIVQIDPDLGIERLPVLAGRWAE